MAKPIAPLSATQAAKLSTRIRKLRQKLALDQGELAKLVGVSQQVVSTWEAGKHLRQLNTGMRLGQLLDKNKL